MNVNHLYMRGKFRKCAFGNGHYGCAMNRGFNVGRGMFHNPYPRGFPTGIGNFGDYGRGQAMQPFRPPVKTNFHPSANMHDDELPTIC